LSHVPHLKCAQESAPDSVGTKKFIPGAGSAHKNQHDCPVAYWPPQPVSTKPPKSSVTGTRRAERSALRGGCRYRPPSSTRPVLLRCSIRPRLSSMRLSTSHHPPTLTFYPPSRCGTPVVTMRRRSAPHPPHLNADSAQLVLDPRPVPRLSQGIVRLSASLQS